MVLRDQSVWEVRYRKRNDHEPSISPRRKRTAASWLKFFVKPWLIDKTPHKDVTRQM